MIPDPQTQPIPEIPHVQSLAELIQRMRDEVRRVIRSCHYSLRTEEQYVHWVRCYVRFHGLRHPRDMAGRGRKTVSLSGRAVGAKGRCTGCDAVVMVSSLSCLV